MLNWSMKRNQAIDMGDEWNVGDECPLHPHRIAMYNPGVRGFQVVANGAELELIREYIHGIRLARGGQVVWNDDEAVFILNNLPRPSEYEADEFKARHAFIKALELYVQEANPDRATNLWRVYEANQSQFSWWIPQELRSMFVTEYTPLGPYWPTEIRRNMLRLLLWIDGPRHMR